MRYFLTSLIALLFLNTLSGCEQNAHIPLGHGNINFKLRDAHVQDVGIHITEWLNQNPQNGSWLVVLTDQVDQNGLAAFAQISIKDGVLGVDHVLNNGRNIETQDRFHIFAGSQGVFTKEARENGVSYIRFTTNNPVEDIEGVLSHVFGIDYKLVVGIFGRVENDA